MAAAEMYDYVSTVSADYDYTLVLKPQSQAIEEGGKRIYVKEYDDGSETRIVRSNTTIFYVTLSWTYLSESDAGTLFALYHDPTKANGMARSFKWTNYTEPTASQHTYVVRFDAPLARTIMLAEIYGYNSIRLKVLGRIAA